MRIDVVPDQRCQHPPATLPYHTLRSVMMTPYMSGWTEGRLTARASVIAGDIERTKRGELPLNAIAPPS